jgi:two-component system, OmpR family, response regulator
VPDFLQKFYGKDLNGISGKNLLSRVKIFLWQYNCHIFLVKPGNNINDITGSAVQYMTRKVLSKIKALIIEDETDICYLLSSILKLKNIQTTFAGSLSEADRILQNNSPPRIIFLDNYLPDGFGINHIGKLKKRFPAIKIVMMTAHDNISDREKAQLEGVDFFIGKPFSRELVFQTIDALTA